MKNASDISCRETLNTHFRFNSMFFEKRAVYEIMWKNIAEWSRPHMKTWCMRNACWIPKATNTPTQVV